MEFAGHFDDPGGMIEAFYLAGQTMLYRGDFAGARDRFATAVAGFDDRERVQSWAARTGHDAGVANCCNLAVSLWHLGYRDQALKVNQKVRQLAREIGLPFDLAYWLHHTAWLFQYCRLGVEVQAAADEEVAIAAEQGFALRHATGTFFMGAGMLPRGDLVGLLPLLRKGLDAFQATGSELHRPFQLGVLGDACTQAGRFGEALAALDEGLAVAEKNDDLIQEAELRRLKGELSLAEAPSQTAAAEDCLTRAVATRPVGRSRPSTAASRKGSRRPTSWTPPPCCTPWSLEHRHAVVSPGRCRRRGEAAAIGDLADALTRRMSCRRTARGDRGPPHRGSFGDECVHEMFNSSDSKYFENKRDRMAPHFRRGYHVDRCPPRPRDSEFTTSPPSPHGDATRTSQDSSAHEPWPQT